MEEKRVDLRIPNPDRKKEGLRTERLLHRYNQAEPHTAEAELLMKELFCDNLGDNSKVLAPLYVNLAANVHIGNHVTIMPYFKCMSAGQVTIEDDVRIAMNVSVITNNHDFYERDILTVQNVHICKNAWVGAGATILPGVTIGENAVVGAASVVTKDVPANAIVAGNPAKLIRMLDAEKFTK